MDATPSPTPPTWSRARLLAFRFAALYFALYSLANLSQPLGFLPGITHLQALWESTLPFVGERLLGIEGPIAIGPNGSGDTTAEYVRVLMIFVIALLGCIAWTLLDRTRPSHPRAAAWLTTWARYWLGSALVVYGFYKLFEIQFPYPDVVRLSTTYGDSSPMGLAWTFMGQSTLYNVFTGGAELLAGLLLCWRRTTSLGALVAVGVMANVLVLNLGYDIPVKLFSAHLLVVALVLASLDAERLLGVLVLGRAVPAREVLPVLATRRRLRLALKSVYLTALLGLAIAEVLISAHTLAIDVEPPLYGLYDVVIDERRGEALVESDRWRQIAVGRYGRLLVHPLHGRGTMYMAVVDTEAHTLELMPPEGDDGPILLHYEESEDGTLLVDGTLDGVHHRATLHRVDESELLLVSRGFHWINEMPFHR